MKKSFSLIAALKFGFSTVLEHFAFFITVMLIYLGVLLSAVVVGVPLACLPFATEIFGAIKQLGDSSFHAQDVVKELILNNGIVFSFSLLLALFALYLLHRLVSLGIVRISLDYYDERESSVTTLFSCWPLLGRDIAASILYWLMCAIGLLFFVVPGIYFAITYGFYHYAIVDKNAGVFEAFRISKEITYGSKMDLLALVFLLWMIRWISLTIFGLTLFIIVPAVGLTYAYVYRKLAEKKRIS
jgi:uncharacterized membrane protein